MAETISMPSPRQIEKSLLVVDREHPLDTLPFISDVLLCMGAFFQLDPALDKTDKAEVGAGLILDLLAYAIEDVQGALETKYSFPEEMGN